MHDLLSEVGVVNYPIESKNYSPSHVKNLICEVTKDGKKEYEVRTRVSLKLSQEGQSVRVLSLPEIVKLCEGLYNKEAVKPHCYSCARDIQNVFENKVYANDSLGAFISNDAHELSLEHPIADGELNKLRGSLSEIQREFSAFKSIFATLSIMSSHAIARREQDTSLLGRINCFFYKIFRSYEKFIDRCFKQMASPNFVAELTQEIAKKLLTRGIFEKVAVNEIQAAVNNYTLERKNGTNSNNEFDEIYIKRLRLLALHNMYS